jgi:hypothetical protein
MTMSDQQDPNADDPAVEPAAETGEPQTFFDDPGGQATTRGADPERFEKR